MPRSQRSSRYWWIRSVGFSDFSGGLNLRDSPNEIAMNETPRAFNWTLDTRGAARVRNGSLNVVALPGVSTKPAFIFYSAALDQWLCARETAGAPNRLHLFSYTAGLNLTGGSWTDRGDVANTSTLPLIATFVDFPGSTPKVVISSGQGAGVAVGAIYTWDGTTLTLAATAPGGYAMALWQNRVWLAGYPTSNSTGNPTRLFASKIGDPTVWAPPDGLTVDIRDKDGEILTGLGIAGGSLIVFKKRSAYRVNDSTTGSYSTIDSSVGCMGPLAVVALRGRLYTWGADSLYEWDGVGPGVKVGDKARPLFATDPALVGGVPGLAGSSIEDRALFAYPDAANGPNTNLLEYDPQHGWLMRSYFPGTTYTVSSFARKGADLYAAMLDGDVIFKVMSEATSSDDINRVPNYFRTAWVEPAGGMLCRIIRADIEGLLNFGGTNTFTFRVYKDGDFVSYDEYDLTADLRAASATDQTQHSIVHSLGHARSFLFEIIAGTAAGTAQVNSIVLEAIVMES